MMSWAILLIAITAFSASLLTFFSGFGLGTILTPVFMIFFPIDIAIALTGVVHLSNNLFKFLLIGKNINKVVLAKFGIPAIFTAFLGAQLLNTLTGKDRILWEYELWEKSFQIMPIKLIIAALMIFFAIFELVPQLKKIQFPEKLLILGGALSGFFGGLSGHQGALRSAFLVKVGLSKETFIATGIAIACFIDITRIPVYFSRAIQTGLLENISTIIIAILAAFIGAFLGRKLLQKVTIDFVQTIVAVAIIVLAIGLAFGFF